MSHCLKSVSSKVLVVIVLVFFALPAAAAEKITSVEDTAKFCGVWEYENRIQQKEYLKVVREGQGRFKISTGDKYKGKFVWQETEVKNAEAIYLKPSKGKLQGKFVSSNFYPTHGEDLTYKITLEMKSKNKLLYSVWASKGGKTFIAEATKISD